MLKSSSHKSPEPSKDGVGVGSNSRARHDKSKIDDRRKIDGGEIDDGEIKDDEFGKKVQKTSKSKNLSKSKITIGTDFFTLGAKLTFTKLRQVFLKAPILYYFDLERHIQIKMNVSGYAISGVFGQLNLDDLGQWHPVAFFF